MRLLLHEYITGGGLWSEPNIEPQSHPLFLEGRAMANALRDDLAQIAGLQLVQLVDARLEQADSDVRSISVSSQQQERELLDRWSRQVEATLLIAPEIDGQLLERAEIVQQAGGQLISPDSEFIKLTADKLATAGHLRAANVPVPQSILIDTQSSQSPVDLVLPPEVTFPAVLKPVDGVGSCYALLLRDSSDWQTAVDTFRNGPRRRWLLQSYCAGLPVSVAALCGPRDQVLLPPCQQIISDDNCLSYLGGRFPLAPDLVRRACTLARRTLATLPPTLGYIGIDMVLGALTTNAEDIVLDVNPRLTTSYVGLRTATSSNLAAAMLTIAGGNAYPLFFQRGTVEFDCQGERVEMSL